MGKILLFCFVLFFSVTAGTVWAQSLDLRTNVSINLSEEEMSQMNQFIFLSDTDFSTISKLKRTNITIMSEDFESDNVISIFTFFNDGSYISNVERKKLEEIKLKEDEKEKIFNSIFFSNNN